MRCRFTGASVLLVGLLCYGCGSDELCDWLTGDNCWKQSLVAAQACLPGEGVVGTFSADRSSCTYSDGTVVEFAAPVPPDSGDFEVKQGGTLCVGLEGLELGFRFTTSIGTFENSSTDGKDFKFICPDGSQISGSDVTKLYRCKDAHEHLLYTVTEVSPDAVSMEMHIGTSGIKVTLFSCVDP